ncbi:MAG: preprotein translocase subunit SecE [Patescibacteria group bacterium]|jgi:preprotein translocase subunit SecE
MQKIIRFFNEVKVEFKNISWPKKDTLIQLSVVVISISILTSLILGGFDYLFTNSIALLSRVNNPASEVQIEPEIQIEEATPSAESPSSTESSEIQN